jgi:hypothetical protein
VANINARVNCMSYVEESNDEVEWLNVPLSFEMFKCARIKTNNNKCESYAIRMENLNVEYDLGCDESSLRNIIISNTKEENVSSFGGLCGTLNHVCSNYLSNPSVCERNSTLLYAYWK